MIEAGSGHSAIPKREQTERMIRQFEEAACMEITAPNVKVCCKVPGNLKSTFRAGDVIRYQCRACGAGHWRAFMEPGSVEVHAAMVNARRTYEIHAALAATSTQGSNTK